MKADQGRKKWLGARISEPENSGSRGLLIELASQTPVDAALATGGTYARSPMNRHGWAPASPSGFVYKLKPKKP